MIRTRSLFNLAASRKLKQSMCKLLVFLVLAGIITCFAAPVAAYTPVTVDDSKGVTETVGFGKTATTLTPLQAEPAPVSRVVIIIIVIVIVVIVIIIVIIVRRRS